MIMNKELLKQRLDDDEEMTDKEKREVYFAELARLQDYEDWCDSYKNKI